MFHRFSTFDVLFFVFVIFQCYVINYAFVHWVFSHNQWIQQNIFRISTKTNYFIFWIFSWFFFLFIVYFTFLSFFDYHFSSFVKDFSHCTNITSNDFFLRITSNEFFDFLVDYKSFVKVFRFTFVVNWKSFINTLTFIDNLSITVITQIFEFHRFLQTKLKSIDEFNEKIKQIIVVIVASHFVFTFSTFNSRTINTKKTIFVESMSFFVKWNMNINRFRRVFQKFRKHTVFYKKSTVFRNFIEIWQSSFSSIFNNFFNERQISITNVSRRNQQFYNVLSSHSTSNYSSFSNRNQKSQRNHNRNLSSIRKQLITNIFRHVIVKSNIESNTSRRFNNIFDITIEKIIYRNSIDFTLSKNNATSNMFKKIDVVTQQFLNVTTKKIVVRVVKVYFRRNFSQQSISNSFNFFDLQKKQNLNDFFDNENNTSQWKSKKLNFFDSFLSIFFDVDFMIKNDKNFYYRNVHLFCEKIKNLIITKKQKIVRVNFNICFRNFVFIWYIAVFNRLKRFDLRNFFFDEDWIKKLIKRFKSNPFIVIDFFIVERYTIIDVRNERDSSKYVQQIINNVKNVNFFDAQQQLIWVWKNLNFDFKRDISSSLKKNIDKWVSNSCKIKEKSVTKNIRRSWRKKKRT